MKLKNLKDKLQGKKMVSFAIIMIIAGGLMCIHKLISVDILYAVYTYCGIEIFKKIGEERKHTSVSNFLG